MYQKIIKEIENKNLTAIKNFLAQLKTGKERCSRDELYTLFFRAYMRNHAEIIEQFLLYDPKLRMIGQKLEALFVAVGNNAVAELAKLLSRDSNLINVGGFWGNGLLHYAASLGFEEIAKLLIKNGARVDLPNDFGRTPIMLAVANDRNVVFELLISHAAKLQWQDEKKYTPLLVAAEHGNIIAIGSLIRRDNAAIKAVNHYGAAAVHIAAYHNQLTTVEYLVEYDPTLLSARDKHDSTPLRYAFLGKAPKVVFYLMFKDAKESLELLDKNIQTYISELDSVVKGAVCRMKIQDSRDQRGRGLANFYVGCQNAIMFAQDLLKMVGAIKVVLHERNKTSLDNETLPAVFAELQTKLKETKLDQKDFDLETLKLLVPSNLEQNAEPKMLTKFFATPAEMTAAQKGDAQPVMSVEFRP